MIKRYYTVIKQILSFNALSPKWTFHLCLSAFLRCTVLLLIPFCASKIVDYATSKDYLEAFIMVGVFILSSLLYVVCHHYNYYAYEKNSIYTHNKLQEDILNKVTTFDNDFTKKMSTAYLVNTSFKDVSKVVSVPDAIIDQINHVITILITIIILMFVNIYIGIITLVLLIITMISMFHNINKMSHHLIGQRQAQDNITGLIGQVIDGNKEIQAFNMQEDLHQYLKDYEKKWDKSYFAKRKYNDNAWALCPSIISVGKIIIYLIMAIFILNGQAEVSLLVLIIGYYEDIENRINSMLETLDIVGSNFTRVGRIYHILNYNNKNMLSFGDNDNDLIKGKITFNNVSFNYEKQASLTNINFEIPPRSMTAIVGKSGSGKSTIFRLLLRMYKVNKGSILIDDVNIYEYSKDVYPSNVSIVTQQPFIFDMSIRENLSLVDSNVENQVKACKIAGIHDHIVSLPNGYNTKLNKDADNLSLGQRQLLALARTLLSKSEILLFDEVTASLDNITTKKIIKIMKKLKKDHTILIITHKPNLMKQADDIIVIDHGSMVGRGTHKELIANNKYYQTLQKK